MQTVYAAAGGDEGPFRLAEAWHVRMLEDPVVSHACGHGFHPEHTQRLASYWAEVAAADDVLRPGRRRDRGSARP